MVFLVLMDDRRELHGDLVFHPFDIGLSFPGAETDAPAIPQYAPDFSQPGIWRGEFIPVEIVTVIPTHEAAQGKVEEFVSQSHGFGIHFQDTYIMKFLFLCTRERFSYSMVTDIYAKDKAVSTGPSGCWEQ
jgi:hypothetical protein